MFLKKLLLSIQSVHHTPLLPPVFVCQLLHCITTTTLFCMFYLFVDLGNAPLLFL